jgi:L-asparagine transporter-like permease
MALMTLGLGMVLTVNPTLLTASPNAPVYFGHMAGIFEQWVWRFLFLVVATARLIALAVNGTFPSIRWTPQVRVVCSGVSCLLWAEIAYSVASGTPTFGTIVYPGLALLEVRNTYQAFKDLTDPRVH